MSAYDDIFDEEREAAPSEVDKARAIPEVPAPPRCPRWMFHRLGVFCHTCQQVGGKTKKGVSLHVDVPPGGKAKSDFKKPKEKKGKK